MKKVIRFIGIVAMMFSITLTVFAGSIPEDLLHSDDAQIFFAEVVAYHPEKEKPEIEISPIKVIKGNVKHGTTLIYDNPNTVGNFEVKVGNVYLFTYFDENNPTDIFETTSQNPSTLTLKNTTGDMWKRFEKYLNDGSYEKAELKRNGKADTLEKLKNAKTLADLFVLDEADIEKLAVIYPGDGDPAGCYIDTDKFFNLAQEIELMPDNTGASWLYGVPGILIMPQTTGDNQYTVSIDASGKVGSQLSVASEREAEYKISVWDYIKLRAFLPKEAAKHLPLNIPRKYYAAAIIGTAIIIFASAFAVGFVIKKKRKSQVQPKVDK